MLLIAGWIEVRAVSFDWEALFPLALFALYGLAQFLGSRRKKNADPDEAAGEGETAMERARKIREDIQRKIQERIDAANPDGQRAPSGSRSAYDPNLPENQQRRFHPAAPQPSPSRAQRGSPEPKASSNPQRGLASGPVTDIEKRLRLQQKRLAEARQLQSDARDQTLKLQRKAYRASQIKKPVVTKLASPAKTLPPPVKLRAHLLAGLHDPLRIRQAVLYREILDPPLGLR